LGKEIANTIFRLKRQKQHLSETQVYGKFNGAVGNFNAHVIAYPEADWPKLSENFIQSLGLINNPMTTQIEPHDYLAEIFHALIRTNQIILDFNRDMWSYISIDYFKQRNVPGEVGSSTMPHKINPIDFENSEGNIGIGNSILEHMASKLLVSRWQRDLTDSTVLRNIGTAFAYCSLAYQATIRGISRVAVNEEKITKDLDESWEVLTEAVQTIMRKYNLAEPYEKLKLATRGKKITRDTYVEVLRALELPKEAMEQLESLTPQKYIGLADTLAELAQQ
jgi:adenylosuccinate lyase